MQTAIKQAIKKTFSVLLSFETTNSFKTASNIPHKASFLSWQRTLAWFQAYCCKIPHWSSSFHDLGFSLERCRQRQLLSQTFQAVKYIFFSNILALIFLKKKLLIVIYQKHKCSGLWSCKKSKGILRSSHGQQCDIYWFYLYIKADNLAA